MTRTGAKKEVDENFSAGRLKVAKEYRIAAQEAITLAEPGQAMNPAISNIVLAAIAYTDALTAKRAEVVNQQDHAAAPKLLRAVMGSAVPQSQLTRLSRILGQKDEVQYGTRSATLERAETLFQDLSEFGNWVEAQL
ncbi:MAG: hypothetical protein JWQ23_154 [Herminiimonas sp.]|nr:hypothetical protein [Herminiimonas sp.]